MKSYRRYFCVLLCCLLLSGVFSVVANAETLEIEQIQVEGTSQITTNGEVFTYDHETDPFVFVSNDGTLETFEDNSIIGKDVAGDTYDFLVSYYVSKPDNSALFHKSEYETTIYFNDFYYSYLIREGNKLAYFRDIFSVQLFVVYTDGHGEYVRQVDFSQAGPLLSMEASFVPVSDVRGIWVHIASPSYTIGNTDLLITHYIGEFDTSPFTMRVDVTTREEGLLAGVFDKVSDTVQKLKDGFKDTVDNLKEGFKNVVDGLTQLPQKLWEKISEGLKGLFVPRTQALESMKDDFEELLSRKLGAIYQVVDVTFDSWDRISVSDETNTIEFPETTITLMKDVEFTFGGWTVPIVPEGFEFLATAVKTMSGIVCTVLFVNGLRKRYDEVMGVEK